MIMKLLKIKISLCQNKKFYLSDYRHNENIFKCPIYVTKLVS